MCGNFNSFVNYSTIAAKQTVLTIILTDVTMLPQLFDSATQYINLILCSGDPERGICNFRSVSVVSGEWTKSLLSSQSFGAEPGLALMNFWSMASFSNLYGPVAAVKKNCFLPGETGQSCGSVLPLTF